MMEWGIWYDDGEMDLGFVQYDGPNGRAFRASFTSDKEAEQEAARLRERDKTCTYTPWPVRCGVPPPLTLTRKSTRGMDPLCAQCRKPIDVVKLASYLFDCKRLHRGPDPSILCTACEVTGEPAAG